MIATAASQIVCHECDLLIGVPELAIGEKAFCPRCDYLLTANRPHALGMVFAFAIAGLVFLALSTAFPFLGFSAGGQDRTVTLLQSIVILVTEDLPSLAAVVFASIVFIPAAFLLGVVYVSSALVRRRSLPGLVFMLRWVLLLVPWSMAEIFLVGILVSFVKIVSLATVTLGLSFWAYVLFTICMTIAVLYFDKRDFWQRVRDLDHD